MNEQETIDLVLSECRKLEDVLNGDFLNTFCKIHNIEQNRSLLKLKQEVVAKNTFFMDVKKRYALYIINKEGKKCDEYQIKGMVTQRSEYPSLTKERIATLLELLVKEDVVDFDAVIKHMEDSRIIIQEQIENHSKTTAKSAHFNKPLEEYKKITSDVNGMLLWNELEYDYFKHGTKGYLFKILGIDQSIAPSRIIKKAHLLTSKNNNIVIPFEEEQLPKYYVIDIKSQMQYAWEDREAEIMRVLRGEKLYEKENGVFDDYNCDGEDW